MSKRNKLSLYFFATMFVYALMLSVTLPELHSYTNGMALFDEKPVFYQKDTIRLLEYLGEEGRFYYQYRQIPLDMLYIALFAFTYHHILRHFTYTLNLHKWRFVIWLPVIAAIFDFLENVCIFGVLYSFPQISTLISLIPYLTALKMIFGVFYLAVFVILGVMVLLRCLRRKI
ncbi:hypothetical protein [Neisseria dentiae]|nr:hypothetical protein [Neisseria dentiae]QMT44506.1 hypothetical protein H3L92_08500 [Neisseria dentiae]STZ50199.1 Uncharacterised protein [Neisseria dentiae]